MSVSGTTGRKRGRVFRGGMPNYSKIKNDVIGHHDDLFRRGGTYAHLFEKQARHYR